MILNPNLDPRERHREREREEAGLEEQREEDKRKNRSFTNGDLSRKRVLFESILSWRAVGVNSTSVSDIKSGELC